MDSWAMMVGVTMLAFLYFGEKFKAGVYLWISSLFSVIFALRMAEPMFYMATAAILGVLMYRIFFPNEDIRDNQKRDNQ